MRLLSTALTVIVPLMQPPMQTNAHAAGMANTIEISDQSCRIIALLAMVQNANTRACRPAVDRREDAYRTPRLSPTILIKAKSSNGFSRQTLHNYASARDSQDVDAWLKSICSSIGSRRSAEYQGHLGLHRARQTRTASSSKQGLVRNPIDRFVLRRTVTPRLGARSRIRNCEP